MAATTLDLYRAGNKTGPRFDHIRDGEISTEIRDGIEFALAGTGGASTLESPVSVRGTWWRLPAGTKYDDGVLRVRNDYPGHWSWEPAHDMPVAEYQAALRNAAAKFVRV
jgi:hypothetical protein